MIKFTVTTTHEGSELVSDVIMDFSKSGVSVEDKQDLAELWNSTLVWDYLEDNVLNRPDDVKVSGFYEGEISEIYDDLREKLDYIKANCDFVGSLDLTIENIDETDWTEDWKKFYQIINVGNIIVAPVWKKNECTGKGELILINPGSAFGTGEHESTRLCLSLLDEIGAKNLDVIDTGCGSGILGIASLKLGAKNCLFRDIDASALNNLRENLSLNNVFGEVQCASLLEGINAPVDLILANITADILSKMTNVYDCLKKGGKLIMSGIIDKYADDLIKCFEGFGLTLKKRINDGIWVGVLFEK